MKKNNKLIVITGIILTLAIVSAFFAYLFVMTDIFKSNKELFTKYFSQNTEIIKKITDSQMVQIYENMGKQSYQSNMTIKTSHSEGGEISNPLNNLSAKLDIQKNNDEQYLYANALISYEDEPYFDVELIKEQEQYGVRFSDVAKKFVTIENNQSIESVANDLGINTNQLEILMDVIDETEQLITEEQKVTLKNKYLNIIIEGIYNGIFEKQKNAIITYNNLTTKTNAYSVSLTSEQVEHILIEILNNVKNETEILDKLQIISKEDVIDKIDKKINDIGNELEKPTLKLTVHEQKKQTIRTVIEMGVHKIIIENNEQSGEISSKINYLNNESIIDYNIEISKIAENNREKIEIIANIVDDNDNPTINISNEMQILENEINIDTIVSHKQYITTTSIAMQNKIKIQNDFEKTQSLASNNYLSLNSLEQEIRQQFIAQFKERIIENINKKMNLLATKFEP